MTPHGLTRVLMPCGVFLAIAAAEMLWPGRAPAEKIGRRWIGNVSLYLLSAGLFMVPSVAALVAALTAQSAKIGLLPWLALPNAVGFLLALLALDATSYALHWLSHAVAPLWRLHAVHHSDRELDVTTALRHHPVEALAGAAIFGSAVLSLGISPDEVAAYATLEWLVQTLAHANLALPPRWEAAFRGIVVTPGFHQIHHSRERAKTDSNYGQVLTVWDMLFRTASARPAAAPPMAFGLDEFRDEKFQDPHWLLAQPVLTRPRDQGVVASR